jgi:hypothetical protein
MTTEAAGGPHRPIPWHRLETLAVVLVALHSYAVGAMLLFLTDWSLRFAGWSDPGNLFFPRQSGVFHFVVATAYLLEYFRERSITILVAAKAIAVVFLLVLNPWRAAWSIPFSGVADGAMLVGMIFLHVRARRDAFLRDAAQV